MRPNPATDDVREARSGAVDPVDEQLSAYNARDLDRFLACYADDAVVEDAAGATLARGRDDMRILYRHMFDGCQVLHCAVVTRIRVGRYVIDEERITGVDLNGAPWEMHAAAVYLLAGDKIRRVRLLP